MDRALIILGKGLKERGHTVYVMANRYDRKVVETFASKIIEIPDNGEDYLNLNENTTKWLEENWNKCFNANTMPDIVLIGGWPFFSSIPFLKRACKNVVFMDCGAVPIEKYSLRQSNTQNKLRALRKQYLKELSLIVSISQFIADSQSKIDAQGQVPIQTVLLGADHMNMSIWPVNELILDNAQNYNLKQLDTLKSEGKKTILCLGRWEPDCYKNSMAAFNVMPGIKKEFPDCVLLILADPKTVKIPADMHNTIIPIGFPDDGSLVEIMKRVDLGLSFSLWEGFNLPIVEMQWLDRPVLAFNAGAHAEVILHPRYLCRNTEEMIDKACDLLRGSDIDAGMKLKLSNDFHDNFKWSRVIKNYEDIFLDLLRENTRRSSKKSLSLIIDVTNAAKDPANSGVIRVTRRISRELQKYVNPIFVIWSADQNCYVLPTAKEFEILGKFNGPTLLDKKRLSKNDHRTSLQEYLATVEAADRWLLFTETVDEKHARIIRRYARNHNFGIAAIFYDAIPVMYPDQCVDSATKDNHGNYMAGLSECDVVVPISKYSAECLERFWGDSFIKGCPIVSNALPGEFGGYKREKIIREQHGKQIKILCVSTLEPRKNHKTLIQACLLIQEKHPELDWSLTLVGNRYAGAFDIADLVQDISKKNPRISWLGIVDDDTLHRLYQEATFTVYPSIVEGFGMPILESIWHGKPCICSHDGVMSELAEDGGCITTDVLNAQELSDTIYQLSTDKDLLVSLSNQAVSRKIKTWDEYVLDFIRILTSNRMDKQTTEINKDKPRTDNINWEDSLYPECLCTNWQMNHSERLAITALLSRQNPLCSIEVGTFKGGSLSLISQYSKMVYSIDIDPEIPKKFGYFKNTCFLTGPSSSILPILLEELDMQHIPVGFVLIDGDHSREGVRIDLNNLLNYIPKKPLFVVLHDSFNPGCREGMLEANWEKSPYVHYVDIDFIPGRVVEHEGPSHGEMWGGLAMAYLKPEPRQTPLLVNQSAKEMYERLRNKSLLRA